MNIYEEKNISVFRIRGSELFSLAKNIYQYSFNELSAFMKHPGITVSISPEAIELSKKNAFAEAVKLLSQPLLRLSFRASGKVMKTERFSVYGAPSGKDYKFVSLHEDDDMVLLLVHNNADSFCDWWISSFGADVSEKPINFIKPELPYETLVCIFNLIDCYRRQYYTDMMNFTVQPPEEVYEDEYIALLEKAAKCGDARWLMPAMFVLVPGFEKIAIEFQPEHMEYAQNLGFFTHSKNADNGRPVLLLGTSAQFMGMEFTHLWSSAIGLEVSVLEAGAAKSHSRVFFAPTVEANHVISFIPDGEGSLKFKHEALNSEDMKSMLNSIIIPTASPQSVPVAEQPVYPKQPSVPAGQAKFCTNCGTRLSDGAAFCKNCGKACESSATATK